MKTVYRTLALLIALGVVVQAAAIAFGTFGFINEIDRGAAITAASDMPNFGPALHAINGMVVIPALSLLLLIVSFFAKVPHGIRWALLVLVVVAIQINLGFFAFDTPAVGLIHGANAFLVLGLALTAARSAGRPATATSVESADVPAVSRPG